MAVTLIIFYIFQISPINIRSLIRREGNITEINIYLYIQFTIVNYITVILFK